MSAEIKVCLQQKIGSCAGCPAIKEITDLMAGGKSQGDAIVEVRNKRCPKGNSPQSNKLPKPERGINTW
jgi:hypothetical protein